MHLRRLSITLGALALLQASCSEPDPGDGPPKQTTIPVLFGHPSAGNQACAPNFPFLTAGARGGGTVTWTLQSSCKPGGGGKARVSLVDWTFTDRSGRTIAGRHPFTADCPLATSLDGADASLTCTTSPDALPGRYQYYVCMELNGQISCGDPGIEFEP